MLLIQKGPVPPKDFIASNVKASKNLIFFFFFSETTASSF